MTVLLLPLHARPGIVALFAFIGGLSAATAMVIVECVALAIMISNDLVDAAAACARSAARRGSAWSRGRHAVDRRATWAG